MVPYGINNSNEVFSLGIAGKYKATSKLNITLEYARQLNMYENLISKNGAILNYQPDLLSLGIELNSGSHLFQFYIGNSTDASLIDQLARNNSSIKDGNFAFGFTINRTMSLKNGRDNIQSGFSPHDTVGTVHFISSGNVRAGILPRSAFSARLLKNGVLQRQLHRTSPLRRCAVFTPLVKVFSPTPRKARSLYKPGRFPAHPDTCSAPPNSVQAYVRRVFPLNTGTCFPLSVDLVVIGEISNNRKEWLGKFSNKRFGKGFCISRKLW